MSVVSRLGFGIFFALSLGQAAAQTADGGSLGLQRATGSDAYIAGKAAVPGPARPAIPPGQMVAQPRTNGRSTIGTAPSFTFRMLDHGEAVNKKPLIQLLYRRDHDNMPQVIFGGGITALATAQRSNRDGKFGYLMRNPTSANQIGKDVSEAVVHSAQVSVAANMTRRISAFVELLYHPQQSMGGGTITSVDRNQIVARRAYLVWGDLAQSPVYFAIGKMDTPFGLNDTVSPFTNSTNWHAFSGLAYGAQIGVVKNGWHVRAMAIQGGAQFRAANVDVQDTNVPSRLNNYAVDANYSHHFNRGLTATVGGSYTHGSAYCQNYPVSHFDPCTDNNPAYAVYGVVDAGPLKVLAEFAETTDIWPGTAVPDQANPLSQYEAVKARALTVGGRYGVKAPWSENDDDFFLSLEFSQFTAGDDGAPWERQNQYVLGASQYLTPSVNAFGEYVHVDGFVPLNFLSGGNLPNGETWSDRDAKTDVVLMGLQAAF
ncbi:MAG: hypothetical protein ACWA5T_10640 [Parvularcula sp.]